MTDHKILILPGDGIGPEVMAETQRVMSWFADHRNFSFETTSHLVGGASYDAHGVPITEEAMEEAARADAILFGAVGGERWETVPYEQRPEAALLRLRKELDLFANLRPALVQAPLADASSLKRELVEGLDILILRELTGGVYFGTPRGIEDLGGGKKRGVNTHAYTSDEIRRAAEMAFDLARLREARLCSVEKRNVMEAGALWHEEVVKLHAEKYTDVALSHMLADNCAMQLVRAPKQFDVILTDNLFGDILSDIAAQLTGSLGMLPSASLGQRRKNGTRPALYEPVHGSAPDIAGRDAANPLAMILSFAMALRYSFERPDDAALLEEAVERVLADGLRTADIARGGKSERLVSCSEMGSAVIDALKALAL